MPTYPTYLQWPTPPFQWVWAPYIVRPSPSLSGYTLSPAWSLPSSPSSSGSHDVPATPAVAYAKFTTGSDNTHSIVDLPSIDPLIAFSAVPGALPPYYWDVLEDPDHALAADPSFALTGNSPSSLRHRAAARVNASKDAPALRTLTLVLRHLTPIYITVLPTRPSKVASVADVLHALHRGLLEPVSMFVLGMQGEEDRARLQQNARAREKSGWAHPRLRGRAEPGTIRNIDFLAKHRRFLGIRPAMRHEAPDGARFGEVFVVELDIVDG